MHIWPYMNKFRPTYKKLKDCEMAKNEIKRPRADFFRKQLYSTEYIHNK